jgi:hypothetical protein
MSVPYSLPGCDEQPNHHHSCDRSLRLEEPATCTLCKEACHRAGLCAKHKAEKQQLLAAFLSAGLRLAALLACDGVDPLQADDGDSFTNRGARLVNDAAKEWPEALIDFLGCRTERFPERRAA